MTALDVLWYAGVLVLAALVLAGPVRWLNRWCDRYSDERRAHAAALAAARRVPIHGAKTPDEEL